jgi:hypothetical protein
MTNDHDHPEARSGQASSAGQDHSTQAERDAAARAVRDNMERLRALRLAREAAEPQRATPTKAKRAKTTTVRSSGKKEELKPQALSDWLAGQQSGGHRT